MTFTFENKSLLSHVITNSSTLARASLIITRERAREFTVKEHLQKLKVGPQHFRFIFCFFFS